MVFPVPGGPTSKIPRERPGEPGVGDPARASYLPHPRLAPPGSEVGQTITLNPALRPDAVLRGASIRVWLAALVVLLPATALAHAFPERAEPRVGAAVRTAPTRVAIWFDGDLEPRFSTLMVTDGAGRRVDNGDGGVAPGSHRLLQAGLQPLVPGTYKVTWRVLAVDGHRTEGDFTFTVRPAVP